MAWWQIALIVYGVVAFLGFFAGLAYDLNHGLKFGGHTVLANLSGALGWPLLLVVGLLS